ncbi:DUF563 domain-containing protein [uncultured Fibrella sp.]|uniref:glycosyltransferase family 61 protein n=1 Tax=uncultured Fibrella sp. TaxID=1284596 RepID=UPI0035CA1354
MVKRLAKKTFSVFRQLADKPVRWVLERSGTRLLTKEQTITRLRSHKQLVFPATHVKLPEIHKLTDPTTVIFQPTESFTNPSFVWSLDRAAGEATLLPYGAVKLDADVLCTDYDTDGYYTDLFSKAQRKSQHTTTLLAPWSQYLDGARFGGYYDFVLLVAAKLARMKEAMPADEFAKAAVAYPLFDTSYEREYFSLLGIEADQLFDSRTNAFTFERCILGNSGHWFYPNPADILTLKKQVENRLPPEPAEPRRIYISRSGRRRIMNEAALIDLLKRFDFSIIDDVPRSVSEQVAIYRSASFIVGPHGASFSNIIWCNPGTHLLELFSPNYTPNFFQHLTNVLGLHYSAYYTGKPAQNRGVIEALEEDITVSIDELEQYLNALL